MKSPISVAIDTPHAFDRVYDQAITISGSIGAAVEPVALHVASGDQSLGTTRIFSKWHGGYRFRLLAHFDPPLSAAAEQHISLRVQLVSDASEHEIASIPLRIVPAGLSELPYGEVLPPQRAEVLHRHDIYGSGPPVEHPSEEALGLVLQFLPARASVLDVGCGAGAYGPPLIAANHRWIGIEIDARCSEILQRRGLEFRQLAERGAPLPCTDGEFDAAIAIEVLEHVHELHDLLAEVARVTRSRFLISVPNMEVIPYFAPLGVVPWHLLEATHVNFFTRSSLRAALARHFSHVEVFSYGEHPVHTRDGLPLHLHLFAIADR